MSLDEFNQSIAASPLPAWLRAALNLHQHHARFDLGFWPALIRFVARRQIIGLGGSRLVVAYDPDTVAKIAICTAGIAANATEARLSAQYGDTTDIATGVHYASCHLVPSAGLGKVLLMERITPWELSIHGEAPEWAAFVDNQQIGYTKSGRLAAYDFG